MSTSFILNPHRFGAAADPGLTLLQGATLWLDASDDIANAQWVRNKGTGGRSLDAREGSVGSAQVVKGALKLPGVNGNWASTPDSAALDGFNDLEIVARVAATDWTPGARSVLVSKRNGAGSDMAYAFAINTAGTLYALINDTVGFTESSSTAATGFTDGEAKWIRLTRTASTGTVRFYTAADQASEPGAWTQLGADVVTIRTAALRNSGEQLAIGAYQSGTAEVFNGTIFRVIVRNGIGGTTVFDADFTAVSDLATSFTESSSNAATVTINSTTGVDTNDPLLLTHAGTNYLYLPGANNDFASSPDSAAVSPTGDLEILMRVALTDWTPSAINYLIAKSDGATNRTFQLFVDTTGVIVLSMSTDSTSFGSSVTSSAPPFTNDSAYWLRVTRTQSTGAVTFEYAADSPSIPSSWSALAGGTGTTSALSDNGGLLRIGNTPSNLPLNGRVYRAVLRKTISGSNDFDADFTANTNQSSFTESSSNAATVTINRSTSGRKAVMVTRPVWLFGTDDYMEVADNALLNFGASESLTVVVVTRRWATPPDFGQIIAKTAGSTSAGWVLLESNVDSRMAGSIADGTTQLYSGNLPQAINYTAGSMLLASMVRDTGADTLQLFVGSSGATAATDTTTGSLANALPVNIGRAPSGTPYYLDMEVVAVAVFRSALTSTQLGQIATYYGV